MFTGDHTVIAKETARALGLGANIQEAGGLPSMDADGKIPKDLGKKYGAMIIAADGFAQVGWECCGQLPLHGCCCADHRSQRACCNIHRVPGQVTRTVFHG
jgi:hypothetical protein